MKDLFFSEKFRLHFTWGKLAPLSLGSILPQNKKQISDGLKNLSSASIRNRFLGSKKEFSDKELEYLTHLDGWNHYALGIEETQGSKRGVAIIRLVRSSEIAYEGEIAITIIDEYQRKGLGSLLIDLISLAALERGITRLSFTFLPQNEAIKNLIKKIGIPTEGPVSHDALQLYVELKKANIESIKSRVASSLPLIDTFHLRT